MGRYEMQVLINLKKLLQETELGLSAETIIDKNTCLVSKLRPRNATTYT